MRKANGSDQAAIYLLLLQSEKSLDYMLFEACSVDGLSTS
jgi:hypothetical protein